MSYYYKNCDEILEEYVCNKLNFMCLNLGSLDTVQTFATEFNGKKFKTDNLINNAGVSRLCQII